MPNHRIYNGVIMVSERLSFFVAKEHGVYG